MNFELGDLNCDVMEKPQELAVTHTLTSLSVVIYS